MTQEFYTKYKHEIESAINSTPVSYNMSASKSGNVALHCYGVKTKKVSIAAYAIKNNTNRSVSKYILKITIAKDTKNQKQYTVIKDTADFAHCLYHRLRAKSEAQIARTQLKKNFHNTAFVRKR